MPDSAFIGPSSAMGFISMTDLIQVVTAVDDPALNRSIEMTLHSAGFRTTIVQAQDRAMVADAGAEMLDQIRDNLINPTQVFILPPNIVDRMHIRDSLLGALGRDASDPREYGGYPPVIIVTGPMITLGLRPNIFSISEFNDLSTDQLSVLFHFEDSVH